MYYSTGEIANRDTEIAIVDKVKTCILSLKETGVSARGALSNTHQTFFRYGKENTPEGKSLPVLTLFTEWKRGDQFKESIRRAYIQTTCA
jgi:hypothetical protein